MVDMRFAAASRESSDAAAQVRYSEDLAPTDEIDVYVGQRLRKRRTELGISQGSLGRQLGVTFSQVQKYEKGTNRIGAGRLYHIAAFLGVSTLYFFEGLEGAPHEVEGEDIADVASDAASMRDLVARISDPHARQALLSLASSMATG